MIVSMRYWALSRFGLQLKTFCGSFGGEEYDKKWLSERASTLIRRDQELAEALRIENDSVTLLTVHLISEPEYRLIRTKGLDPLLDLFDEHDYPPIFDLNRPSYV